MLELTFTLIGVVVGFLLNTSYERLKNRKITDNVRLLLRRELEGNMERLKEVLTVLEGYGGVSLPGYIKPLTINEIADRTEGACQRESFGILRRDLPLLGTEAMNAIIEFYESSRQIPRTFREIERWAGNIRVGLFEDNIKFLVEKAGTAVSAIAA